MKFRTMLRYGVTFVFVLLLASCVIAPQAGADKGLKMGLIPVLDVMPFYIAENQGYFTDEGIEVELVPIKSAQERDALMQAGEIDGMLADLISSTLLNRESNLVKVVAKVRKSYPDAPQIRILAAPGSEITSPAELANVPIGISQNTMIEYLTDRMLVTGGLPAEQIVVEEVSAIPTRFELLINGQLQAATLPDPMAQAAIAAGATLIIDDAEIPQFSQSVLTFSRTSLENKPETVRAFLRAWNRAVRDINENPEAYRDVLIEKTRVPESVQGTYKIPPFPENEITSAAEWEDVGQWLLDKGLLDRFVPYEEAVDQGFIE
jgi:NitT/TauT family transport system substrate-binding protein